MIERYAWWQRGIIYQIYPRSFMDSNGDGCGDLRGISEKLDYLVWLGVDAIWISPIFPSPMADFGYDVSNYCDVDPLFGTLADLDALIAAAHARDIKVVLDYVPNHTSEQHPWFEASRSARDNPHREWYIWHDPAPDGGPPNNWRSVFGGNAWTLDPTTGQYYYHAYLPQQPDLNWRNPNVQVAMFDVLRFWLDRGVDGFRIDALRQLYKDDHLRDNPPNPEFQPGQSPYNAVLPVYTADRPELLQTVAVMRDLSDQYADRLLIGELYLPIERLVKYYGVNGRGLHLPFNFHLISTPWNADAIGALIDSYEAALPPTGWPNWVIGNHDRQRIASRVGLPQARVAAMLLLTLRGTPTLYNGDELGIPDVPIPPEMVQDPVERRVPGIGMGRDPERTPMQWDRTANAGFTTGTPWLPLATDWESANVAVEREDPHSMLTLYRRLIELRRASPALAVGAYRRVPASGSVLCYLRSDGDERILVVLNLGHADQSINFAAATTGGTVVLSTHANGEDEIVGDRLIVRGDEGLVIRLSASRQRVPNE